MNVRVEVFWFGRLIGTDTYNSLEDANEAAEFARFYGLWALVCH